MMNRKRVSWVLYGIVALVFAVAGIGKIVDPEQFLSSLLTFETFAYKQAVVIALFAPWLEVVLGASLLTGLGRRGAAWLTGGILLLFIALIVQARLRGLSIDCGCFGSNLLEDDFAYAKKIAQDVLLVFALWGAVALENRSKKTDAS